MSHTQHLQDLMNVVATSVTRTISSGCATGLSRDASALAAAIGVISYLRAEGVAESVIDTIVSEARKAVPTAEFMRNMEKKLS